MRAMPPGRDILQWAARWRIAPPSFKLEHLAESQPRRAKAMHTNTVRNVRAQIIIGIRRGCVKQVAPRNKWDYRLKLRDKRFVGGLWTWAAN